jgi:hypothetical protein
VFWTASSLGTYVSVGSSLGNVKRDCTRPPLFNSSVAFGEDGTLPLDKQDPTKYANNAWAQAAVVLPNGSVVVLIHNEFDMSNGSAMWSTGLGICDDVGKTSCRLVAKPPLHRVFSLPYRYNGSLLHTVGYGAIGNGVMKGDDGAYYGIVNVAGQEAQVTGNCAWRSETPADPSSYRGWKAAAATTTATATTPSSSSSLSSSSSSSSLTLPGDGDFTMTWVDPYVTEVTDASMHVCDPIPSLQISPHIPFPAAYHVSPRRLRGVPGDGTWPTFAMLADQGVGAKKRDSTGE